MQQTFTAKLSDSDEPRIRAALESASFDFRPLNHAHWQARSAGCVVSFYKSGKIVLQGKNAEEIAALIGVGGRSSTSRRVEPGQAAVHDTTPFGRALAKLPEPLPNRWIGIDEAGKGDYFGPLVTVAALVEREQLPWLAELGVGDSKRIKDGKILELDHFLRDAIPHETVILFPETYNRLYGNMKNLNKLLAWSHATAAATLVEEHDADLIISDQFTRSSLVADQLKSKSVNIPHVQRTKAEDDPAVAVASIFARAAFVRGVRKLSGDADIRLPLGAGAPIVPAGKRLILKHGADALGGYAKLHFKTTNRILGG